MTITEWRYLDGIESMTEDVNMYAAPCFEFHGKLDSRAFEKAYRVLSIRHPVLRSFITESNNRYVLETRENEYPEVTFIEGDKELLVHLQKQRITSSANEPADKRAASNIIVISNEHGGYIIFRLRHSICDPYNIGAFQSLLLDTYTDIACKKEVPANPGSLPSSPLRILEEQWGKSHFYFKCPEEVPSDLVEGFFQPINFSQKDTDALLTIAQQHNTTLGSLLLGEIALAFKRCNPEHTSSTVKINTLVSLRNRLQEPVSETGTTYLTGRCIIPINVANGDNTAAALGRQFKEKLQDSVEKREVYIAGYSMDTLGATLNSVADIRFNNGGKFPEIRTPKGMKIVDYAPLNHPLNNWRTTTQKNNPALDAVSWTMNGELVVWLRGHLGIRGIVPELENNLKNAIDSLTK